MKKLSVLISALVFSGLATANSDISVDQFTDPKVDNVVCHVLHLVDEDIQIECSATANSVKVKTDKQFEPVKLNKKIDKVVALDRFVDKRTNSIIYIMKYQYKDIIVNRTSLVNVKIK